MDRSPFLLLIVLGILIAFSVTRQPDTYTRSRMNTRPQRVPNKPCCTDVNGRVCHSSRCPEGCDCSDSLLVNAPRLMGTAPLSRTPVFEPR